MLCAWCLVTSCWEHTCGGSSSLRESCCYQNVIALRWLICFLCWQKVPSFFGLSVVYFSITSVLHWQFSLYKFVNSLVKNFSFPPSVSPSRHLSPLTYTSFHPVPVQYKQKLSRSNSNNVITNRFGRLIGADRTFYDLSLAVDFQ